MQPDRRRDGGQAKWEKQAETERSGRRMTLTLFLLLFASACGQGREAGMRLEKKKKRRRDDDGKSRCR